MPGLTHAQIGTWLLLHMPGLTNFRFKNLHSNLVIVGRFWDFRSVIELYNRFVNSSLEEIMQS